MVFAAVPVDVTIEKLTGPQKRALDEYLGRESRTNYFTEILGNENIPVVIGGFLAGIFAVNLAEDIIEDIENTVGPVAEKTKSAIQETVEIRLSRPAAIREAVAKAIRDFELPKDFKIGGEKLA